MNFVFALKVGSRKHRLIAALLFIIALRHCARALDEFGMRAALSLKATSFAPVRGGAERSGAEGLFRILFAWSESGPRACRLWKGAVLGFVGSDLAAHSTHQQAVERFVVDGRQNFSFQERIFVDAHLSEYGLRFVWGGRPFNLGL
ncbi:hypothetical protein SY1_17150 [Fretibacterium fastidiosum]|uniref:Uncharacterized protein n=1 Tax=Fretibacterium fastidiosum TaxID=651822 RepID=A0AB94IY30_9BACT|nr:hypothetical protein SY1_17150 [Fretibacterium fastidiosum]